VPDWADMVLVGRIARPHGLRGDVVINPETDFVEERFAAGSTLWMPGREVRIASARVQGRRPVVRFEGFDSIDAVQGMAGQELRVPIESLPELEDGKFYHHELAGCHVETVSGRKVGEVVRVEGGAGGSRLVISSPRGEVLVPLATDICVEIDVDAKRIRIDPPDGLLELNEV
jgi:16S rRNA processing protein RimM